MSFYLKVYVCEFNLAALVVMRVVITKIFCNGASVRARARKLRRYRTTGHAVSADCNNRRI
jgi:hypothetical protein